MPFTSFAKHLIRLTKLFLQHIDAFYRIFVAIYPDFGAFGLNNEPFRCAVEGLLPKKRLNLLPDRGFLSRL